MITNIYFAISYTGNTYIVKLLLFQAPGDLQTQSELFTSESVFYVFTYFSFSHKPTVTRKLASKLLKCMVHFWWKWGTPLEVFARCDPGCPSTSQVLPRFLICGLTALLLSDLWHCRISFVVYSSALFTSWMAPPFILQWKRSSPSYTERSNQTEMVPRKPEWCTSSEIGLGSKEPRCKSPLRYGSFQNDFGPVTHSQPYRAVARKKTEEGRVYKPLWGPIWGGKVEYKWS